MLIKRVIFTVLLTTALISPAISSSSALGLDPQNPLVLFVGRNLGDSPAWLKTADGMPTFWLRAQSWDLPDIGAYSAPAFGDLDNDGAMDALVGRSQGDCLAYENIGTTSSPVWNRKPAWDCPEDVGDYAVPELADINADGLLDLIVGNAGGEIRIYKNTGSNTSPIWTRNRAWEIRTGSQYAFPRVVDLNHDLLPDLLVGTRYDGVKAYRNIGTASSPTWSYMSAWNAPSIGERTTIAVADMDGDGDFDLMLGDRAGDVVGFANVGSVTNPQWQPHPAWNLGNVGGYSAPYIVDLAAIGPPPPPPPPPPPATENINVQNAMFAFHYHNVQSPDTYGPADYLTLSVYLEEQPPGIFLMPFGEDVKITIEIPDPLDQSKERIMFTQTIPAGSVQGGGTSYRFTSSPPGIRDLEFSRLTSNSILMYLEAEEVYFLPDLKKLECWPECPLTPPSDPTLASACSGCYSGNPLTPLQYRNNYILPIPSFTITVEVDGNIWEGGGRLRPGDYNEHFQKLDLAQ